MSSLPRVVARLTAPIDASGVAAFRFVLGVLVAISATRFIAFGWVDEFFVQPIFFFKYQGFEWIDVPSAPVVHAVFYALVLFGVTLALGIFHRLSAALCFVLFTWVQLWDATNYLNHYYLVSLLLLLVACMPLGRVASLSTRWLGGIQKTTVPAWTLYLLRIQVACVYLFAGKAKFGTDWLLHGQPLNIWLGSRTDTPLVGELFSEWWVAMAMSWAGFLFDTCIVGFLLWRRTRPWAYGVLLVFHALTSYLFPIGMFPVIMSVAALIFFPADWPRRAWSRLRRHPYTALDAPAPRPASPITPWTRVALSLGALYCALQILVPLRHHLYGGDVLWHEQGMRFSWKVMVREKNAAVTFYLENRDNNRRRIGRPRDLLDARQEREFGTQPDMLLQLGRAFAERERLAGRNVRVRVEAWVSLNGRRPHLLVDPNVDLTTVGDAVPFAAWVRPAPPEPPPIVGAHALR